MKQIDFIGNSKKYFAVSIILIAAIIICMFTMGVQLDIQFKGGSIITYTYDGALDKDLFAQTVQDLAETNVSIQQSTDLATGLETIVLTLPGSHVLTSEQMVKVSDGLQAAFPENNPRTVAISNVDPTIGKEFLLKCITAIGIAFVLMVLYITWRFKKIGGLSAGIMGVVALIHDVIVVFGAFIIFRIPINDNFIAVALTILGYSINDTIVIYDRIRENKRTMGAKASIAEMVNESINQSFFRSINVTIASILSMIVVTIVALFYGVESILSFSIPMLFGLICGAYSTICIAGPLWVKWQERKPSKK